MEAREEELQKDPLKPKKQDWEEQLTLDWGA